MATGLTIATWPLGLVPSTVIGAVDIVSVTMGSTAVCADTTALTGTVACVVVFAARVGARSSVAS